MNKKLYVGNLSYDATEAELEALFKKQAMSLVLLLLPIVTQENQRVLLL